MLFRSIALSAPRGHRVLATPMNWHLLLRPHLLTTIVLIQRWYQLTASLTAGQAFLVSLVGLVTFGALLTLVVVRGALVTLVALLALGALVTSALLIFFKQTLMWFPLVLLKQRFSDILADFMAGRYLRPHFLLHSLIALSFAEPRRFVFNFLQPQIALSAPRGHRELATPLYAHLLLWPHLFTTIALKQLWYQLTASLTAGQADRKSVV